MKKSRLILLIGLIVIIFLFAACQKTGDVVKKTQYKTLEPKKMAALNLPSEPKTTVTFGTYDASCASKYCCTMDGDRACLKCCEGAVQKDTGESNQNKGEQKPRYINGLFNYLKKMFRK